MLISKFSLRAAEATRTISAPASPAVLVKACPTLAQTGVFRRLLAALAENDPVIITKEMAALRPRCKNRPTRDRIADLARSRRSHRYPSSAPANTCQMLCAPASIRDPPTKPAAIRTAAWATGRFLRHPCTIALAPSTAVEVCADGKPFSPPFGRRFSSVPARASFAACAVANIAV